MFIGFCSKGEKVKNAGEAAFSQGIRVCLLKTNATANAVSDVSQNKSKTCTERIIRPEM